MERRGLETIVGRRMAEEQQHDLQLRREPVAESRQQLEREARELDKLIVETKTGIAAAYVCNNMLWDSMKPDPRWLPWTAALREAIGMEAA